jgi:protein gp37
MAENTRIEWADMTFNPFVGCTRVGPGCDHCYAEAMAKRFGWAEWGPGKPRHLTSAANWHQPLKWDAQPFVECMSCGWRGEARKARLFENPPGFHPPAPSARACPGCGQFTLLQTRARVFCASLADVFDNEVPPAWREDLFRLIGETPNLDWLLLTKRIGNVPAMVSVIPGWIPPNVWLGVTVVNQTEFDRDIPKLLAVSAAKRFLSMEPLLGPVDVTPFLWGKHETVDDVCQNCPRDADCECGYHTRTALKLPALHWVIVGGESGPNARPMHPEWARSLRDQCVDAGVPFFFKQWGEWAPNCLCNLEMDMAHRETKRPEPGKPGVMFRCGKQAAGRLLDGRTWDEVPK